MARVAFLSAHHDRVADVEDALWRAGHEPSWLDPARATAAELAGFEPEAILVDLTDRESEVSRLLEDGRAELDITRIPLLLAGVDPPRVTSWRTLAPWARLLPGRLFEPARLVAALDDLIRDSA